MRPRNRILVGDVCSWLTGLASDSIDCIITSPPYFALRNYGVDGQLGMETHIDDWVANLRRVCHELQRVLAPHGSLWLNLGDCYSRSERDGALAKSLLMGPERVAIALMQDGWLLRNKVIWAKTNPMPNSVRDRLSCTHEYVFLLTKQRRYFFDLDAIRVPLKSTSARPRPWTTIPDSARGRLAGTHSGLSDLARAGRVGHPLGKNPGDVWLIGKSGYRGAHFATFPPELVRRPLLATCPSAVCTNCDSPRSPSSPCHRQAPTRPGLVLDPFFGSGTVGVVAERYARDWLGIELNPEYVAQAEARLGRGSRERP